MAFITRSTIKRVLPLSLVGWNNFPKGKKNTIFLNTTFLKCRHTENFQTDNTLSWKQLEWNQLKHLPTIIILSFLIICHFNIVKWQFKCLWIAFLWNLNDVEGMKFDGKTLMKLFIWIPYLAEVFCVDVVEKCTEKHGLQIRLKMPTN